MNLQKDPRWSSFDDDSYESFIKEVIPEMYFKNNVPDDVKKSFRVIEKLLQHSFYEYEFYDVAVTKALLTPEMALKIRYFELTKDTWNRKVNKGEPKRDLFNLLSWFNERKHFEFTSKESAAYIRRMRNYFVHPERHSYAGSMYRQEIEVARDVINDTYEATDLRKARLLMTDTITKSLNRLIENGALLKSKDMEEIIYSTRVLFIDNKEIPPVYYFAFIPIHVDDGDNAIRNKFTGVSSLDFHLDASSTTLTISDAETNDTVIIRPLSEQSHKMAFNTFMIRLNSGFINDKNFMFLSYDSWLRSQAGMYSNQIRRNFYKK